MSLGSGSTLRKATWTLTAVSSVGVGWEEAGASACSPPTPRRAWEMGEGQTLPFRGSACIPVYDPLLFFGRSLGSSQARDRTCTTAVTKLVP